MSVVAVGEIWERRRSSYRDGKLTHYLMWLVKCDNPRDGTSTAIGASGIPDAGDAFVDAYGNVSYLSGIDCDPRSGSDRHFEISVEFTSLDPSQPDDNPLNDPPGFSFTYNEQTSSYFTDETPANPNDPNDPSAGPKVVANSAGDPFEQFMQRESGELQITMTRNEATHDAVALDAYGHTVNSGIVTLDGNAFDVGTLKLSPIGATKSRKTLRAGNTVVYYQKSYLFKARHEGWHDRPIDIGFNELVGSKTLKTQNVRRIVDSTGNPVSKPWPLDGSGHKKPNATDIPAVLDFQPYVSISWGPLNLA